MLGAGVYWQAILFGFFGVLMLANASFDARGLLRPVASEGRPIPWIFRHIPRMGGSYIATFTAFLVVNLGRWLPESAPGWLNTVGWIAPAVIGGMLIRRAVRAWKVKLKLA